jgi:hypothetical protein
MSIYGEWKSCIVADEGTLSAAVDLGKSYETLAIYYPATIDSATVNVRGARSLGGTYQDIYITDPATGDDIKPISTAGTGGINWITPIGGFAYIKLFFGAAQNGGPYTFYVRGARP